jgi:hypothetical protein
MQRRTPPETPCCLLPIDHACPEGMPRLRS